MMRFLWPLLTSVLLIQIAATAVAENPIAKHVLLIGIDGLNTPSIDPATAPVMAALAKQGAFTLHARAVMPTASAPNWASMLMGAGPEQHGVIANGFDRKKPQVLPTVMGEESLFPTIFSIVRKAYPQRQIDVVYEWDGIPTIIEQGACNAVQKADGPLDATRRMESILEKSQSVFAFIHYDHVDGAGHGHGWGSPEYRAAVAEADRCVGQLLATLDRLKMRSDTLVIISSDHGGINKGHGGTTMEEMEIPWIVSGPGVRSGYEITSPVNQYDTAATIAYALAVPTPECWIAAPVKTAFVESANGSAGE